MLDLNHLLFSKKPKHKLCKCFVDWEAINIRNIDISVYIVIGILLSNLFFVAILSLAIMTGNETVIDEGPCYNGNLNPFLRYQYTFKRADITYIDVRLNWIQNIEQCYIGYDAEQQSFLNHVQEAFFQGIEYIFYLHSFTQVRKYLRNYGIACYYLKVVAPFISIFIFYTAVILPFALFAQFTVSHSLHNRRILGLLLRIYNVIFWFYSLFHIILTVIVYEEFLLLFKLK